MGRNCHESRENLKWQQERVDIYILETRVNRWGGVSRNGPWTGNSVLEGQLETVVDEIGAPARSET